ncbi:MAG TPA: sulfite exporter TauE/SafE family protein [Acidimicrobiia bacterium]|nr:sulfite exporter TauE/SafE family protein [Acidimicrobiia bacterium]
MDSLLEVVLAGVIGLVAGVASGLAGIGGGVIMVPAMVFFLDFPQHLAQGTSLFVIFFTSIAGSVVNRRNANVDARTALVLGLFGAAAAFGAARLANLMDADVLRRLFGVFVLFAGIRMTYQTLRSRELEM